MRGRTAVVAATLAMAPLGARGADLVVWWDKGWYAQKDEAIKETITASRWLPQLAASLKSERPRRLHAEDQQII
jgi:hypothetical protein